MSICACFSPPHPHTQNTKQISMQMYLDSQQCYDITTRNIIKYSKPLFKLMQQLRQVLVWAPKKQFKRILDQLFNYCYDIFSNQRLYNLSNKKNEIYFTILTDKLQSLFHSFNIHSQIQSLKLRDMKYRDYKTRSTLVFKSETIYIPC